MDSQANSYSSQADLSLSRNSGGIYVICTLPELRMATRHSKNHLTSDLREQQVIFHVQDVPSKMAFLLDCLCQDPTVL